MLMRDDGGFVNEFDNTIEKLILAQESGEIT